MKAVAVAAPVMALLADCGANAIPLIIAPVGAVYRVDVAVTVMVELYPVLSIIFFTKLLIVLPVPVVI